MPLVDLGQPDTSPAISSQELIAVLERLNQRVELVSESVKTLQAQQDSQARAITHMHATDSGESTNSRMRSTRPFERSRSPSPDAHRLSSRDYRAIADVVKTLETFDGTSGRSAKQWFTSLEYSVESVRLMHLSPHGEVEKFFLSCLAPKFKSAAMTWYTEFRKRHPTGHDLLALTNDFHSRFISSVEVTQAARAKFWTFAQTALQRRLSIQQCYEELLQTLDSFHDNLPTVPDQIFAFLSCISDEDIRNDAMRDNPNTLNAAYESVNKAIAARASTRVMQARTTHPSLGRRADTNPNPPHEPPRFSKPNPPPEPPSFSYGPNPNPPTLTAPFLPNPPHQPKVSKLTPMERDYCMKNRLCLRCRQPGHQASQCPHFGAGQAPQQQR